MVMFVTFKCLFYISIVHIRFYCSWYVKTHFNLDVPIKLIDWLKVDYELALSVSSCDHSLKTTLLLITGTFFRSKNLKFHWILKTWQRTTLQLAPQTEINFWSSPSAKQCRKSVLGRKVFTNIKKAPWLKSSKSHRQYPNRVKGNLKRISSNSVTGFSGELSVQPKIPEISVGTSNGIDHFGLVRPEFEGAWSSLTGLVILVGRNEMSLSIWPNCSPQISSVPHFCILLTRTITKRAVVWVGSVQPESQ